MKDMKDMKGSSGPFSVSGSLHKEPWPLRRQGLVLAEDERWYVARSLPRREAGAEMQLLAQGFRTFTPRVSKTVRHARKLRAVITPLFPAYMFVVLDLQKDRWRSVNGTFGVASLLMAGELPEPVPRGVVERLLNYTDEAGIARFDRDLREGHPVRVIAGPFARALGRLEHLDANGRVRVLLDIMGGKIRVLLDRSGLEAA
jgi:transcriptional antiterminator RfaH